MSLWRCPQCGILYVNLDVCPTCHVPTEITTIEPEELTRGGSTGDSTDARTAGAEPACDLCGDQGPLFLQARCHLTAPLRVELDGDVLILRCYLPTCGREVGRFHVVRPEKAD